MSNPIEESSAAEAARLAAAQKAADELLEYERDRKMFESCERRQLGWEAVK